MFKLGSQYTYSEYFQSTATTEVDVVLTMSDGSTQYIDLGDPAASSSWTQFQATFTAPTGAVSASVYDIVYSTGSLSVDNFSLVVSTTPTVSITAPAANATVSGNSVQLTASATDSSGIASVQFQINGTNVGSPVTTSPYQYNWNSMTVVNGTYSFTAIAVNTEGVSVTSTPVLVTVNNSLPIGTNIIPNPLLETANTTTPTMPLNWQNASWGTNTTTFSYANTGSTGDTNSVAIQTSAYTSGASEWYFVPQTVVAGDVYTFSDYYQANVVTDVEAELTSTNGTVSYLYLGAVAASNNWTQYSITFTMPAGTQTAAVYQYLSSVGALSTDNYSLATSTDPQVSVTTPTTNIGLGTPDSGNVTLAASAIDNVGVASVQFQVDGKNTGTPVTTAPYQLSWNSVTVANGTHNITAVAKNLNGKTATSAAVSVEISNTNPAGGNMVPNPLLQTTDPNNSSAPQDWQAITWGTNTSKFSYLNSGSTGDTKSVEAQITSYTSGSVEWMSTPQVVAADQQYKFSDYYKTNVASEVDASFYMSDGTIDYQILGFPSASSNWSQFATTFSVPLGAKYVSIYQYISTVGYAITDNYSITPYTPTGFNRALLTLTFDDGYADTYTNAIPLLQQNGFNSTQFIITDTLGDSGYMTNAQVLAAYKVGEEIASHTVTHDDMTQETVSQIKTELQSSQQTLQSITGSSVTDLAYPYGLYNNAVVAAVKQYYTASRGVEDGLNSKDNFNYYDLKVQDVYNTTTTAQIADWVAQAQTTKTWLILVFHSVDSNAASSFDGNIYNVTPTQLSSELAAVKSSGITVETMSQAVKEIKPQL